MTNHEMQAPERGSAADRASEEAEAAAAAVDFSALFEIAKETAVTSLRTQGSFAPFGVGVDLDGSAHLLAGMPVGPSVHPVPVLIELVQGMRDNRDNLRAVAVVTDLLVEGADAIRVECEHRTEFTHTLHVLYRRTDVGGARGIELVNISRGEPVQRVWGEGGKSDLAADLLTPLLHNPDQLPSSQGEATP